MRSFGKRWTGGGEDGRGALCVCVPCVCAVCVCVCRLCVPCVNACMSEFCKKCSECVAACLYIYRQWPLGRPPYSIYTLYITCTVCVWMSLCLCVIQAYAVTEESCGHSWRITWPQTYSSVHYCDTVDVCVCVWGGDMMAGVEGEYYCRRAPDASWQGHKGNRRGVGWTITVIHSWANREGLCH